MIVADSSALLAAIMEEPGGYAFIDRAGGGSISSVNWCEVGTRLSDKGLDPRLFYTLAARFGLSCIPFDQAQADLAPDLRSATRHLGLSLGGRACLALGKTLGLPVVTADRTWRDLDLGIAIQLIR